MPDDWRTAFLRQAQSDFQMFQRCLAEVDVPDCQRLHYLQMTTEKLAKALLTTINGPRPAMTHDAFVRFMRSAWSDPAVREVAGMAHRDQFRAFLRGLEALAQAIENLSPEGPDHPNPEYPWEASGTIISPLDHTFVELNLASPKMGKMLRFVEQCLTLT